MRAVTLDKMDGCRVSSHRNLTSSKRTGVFKKVVSWLFSIYGVGIAAWVFFMGLNMYLRAKHVEDLALQELFYGAAKIEFGMSLLALLITMLVLMLLWRNEVAEQLGRKTKEEEPSD